MKKIISLFIGLFLPLCAMAVDAPQILTDVDASLYEQIFMLQDKEKIDTAIKVENQIADKLLMNEVLYQRYISDSYRTRGREITAWMEKYYDMPGAQRMEKLAKIKKATVRRARVPNIMTGPESIETAQSETWTAKKYTGATNKKNRRIQTRNSHRINKNCPSNTGRQIIQKEINRIGLRSPIWSPCVHILYKRRNGIGKKMGFYRI